MLSNACQKPRPRLLATRETKADRIALDTAESKIAKYRANGRCEIFIVGEGRCTKRDSQTHHMLGGWKRRARGVSALARHKQRTCDPHHKEITGHVLKVLSDGLVPIWTDPYERVA